MIEMLCLKNALIFIQTVLNFRKYENLVLVLQKEDTKIRHQLSQQLQTTWCVFETCYL